ncbi:MAG: DUF5343 domain-containing protein [Clostridia bacterium]|jgi:hypothetical protein
MSLTNAYLTSTKNLEPVINAVLTAKAPDRFTYKFLEDLGFKSSNDRLYINLFKALGLLDESGSPTERYYRFLDQGIYKEVLAEGIREAYEDLFNININAQSLSTDEVKNKLRTLTQGQKTEKVISLMAMTFSALCSIADWNEKENKTKIVEIQTKEEVKSQEPKPVEEKIISNSKKEKLELHYDIQIHLPETRDESVYDAIFSSMKKHLF